jgi:2-iminobutanoate/2-iminopropanoate deaminase
MEKQCIFAPNGAPAVGPYSHAVAVGDLLFVSGQGPIARDGSGVVHGTFEEETRRTLDNLKAILDDAGSGLGHVVKTTVFLADMARFGEFNAIYKEYFPERCPARTCVQAGALPGGIQVEVEAIAALPNA